MSLKEYNRKRNFSRTPEPAGKRGRAKGELRFVVQKHAASRLHYDFRLEMDGALKSWAVPKGPSLNPMDQRLAVLVEDHPIEYGSFEGIIPSGNYGAGTVMIWDEGTFRERSSATRAQSELLLKKGMAKGHITFVLEGEKLSGEFALIKLKRGDAKTWLLVKKRDEHSNYKDVTRQDRSVKTGRSMEEIAEEAEGKGEVWHSRRVKRAVTPAETAKKPKQLASPRTSAQAIPKRIQVMLPAITREPFEKKGWIFEALPEGHRAIAEIEDGRVHIYSRQFLSYDKKYPEIVKALRKSDLQAVLDGVILECDGKHVYRVFDLLFLNGIDLRDTALTERKAKLSGLKIFKDEIEYSIHNEGAPAPGSDPILARDTKSLYHRGTSKEWLKFSAPSDKSDKRGSSPSESKPILTHLDKIMFPKDQITKGALIEYYRSIAPYILPHLRDRPESMNRFPDGIGKAGFFHKDLTGYTPRFIETERIHSHSGGKTINYLLCQNEATLLFMINFGCIELNPWLSRVGSLEKPDFLVIDLDPGENDFSEVVEAARETYDVLEKIGAKSYLKTSGATGLHICVPLQARFDYDTARKFAEDVCKVVHERLPDTTSLDRNPAKRKRKIYLDYMQNRIGQTLASVYCVRPRPGAPVSTPLKWDELTPKLDPGKFTIANTVKRLEKVGDLFLPVVKSSTDLEACAKKLTRLK